MQLMQQYRRSENIYPRHFPLADKQQHGYKASQFQKARTKRAARDWPADHSSMLRAGCIGYVVQETRHFPPSIVVH